MILEQYLFKVEPFYYGTAHGDTRTLTLTIQVNGVEHHVSRVLPNQQPFQNEIEYYSRLATEMLTDKLKELEEK